MFHLNKMFIFVKLYHRIPPNANKLFQAVCHWSDALSFARKTDFWILFCQWKLAYSISSGFKYRVDRIMDQNARQVSE